MIPAADFELMARASRLYYLEEKGQAEIAKLLRISRPGVSRLLQRARREKIVEIRIRSGEAGSEDWSGLERRLGLKELLVAGANTVGIDDAKAAVGRRAAEWLQRNVRKGEVVGLTAGTTLSAFVRAVPPGESLDLEIVPLAGVLWDKGEDFDVSFLCQELRRRTGGTHRVLSAPAVVQDARLARSLRSEPRVRSVMDRYGAVRCAIFGIGRASESHPVARAARGDSRSPRRRRPRTSVLPRDAVASVGCLFFDAKGHPSSGRFDLRTIGISHEELLRVPVRVGLATGLEKLESVHALVRGKVMNVLIIDAALARKLETASREA